MSRFYASIQGSRGEATRVGTKNSGLSGHIRGWNVGCRVHLSTNDKDEDVCTVILTGGSNGSKREVQLGTFTEKDLK